METTRICPNCRTPLPPDVPLGLCPECLIRAGIETDADRAEARERAGSRFVPPPIEEIARLFPQLQILRLIGRGGMGAVYEARQPALDRSVALKVLPPAVAGDPGFAERFNREARALARLAHPNIVGVHDFGKAGPLHYLLMEFVDGANLREVERAGRLAPQQALAIVPQICDALQFAHNEGIVHRDIKPENILLDKRGRIKITDFGIAKMVGKSAGNLSLTGAKDVVGTPNYMAPEQLENPQAVDHRADIFSLGVVFYEMLTGELPLGKFAPPSRKVQVDVRLDEVVLRALEKEPERRYQQASQVRTDVETISSAASSAHAETAKDGLRTHPASPASVSGFSLSRVPWQIWVAVAMLALEGVGNLFAIPQQAEAAMWFAAKVLFITGLLRRWRPVFILVLLVGGVHVAYFAVTVPSLAFLNLLLLALIASAFRFYFPRSQPRTKSRFPMRDPQSKAERRSDCYFSTPERMRRCFPSAAAQIYICKGELRLEPDALAFVTPWQTRIAVPLNDIENLSVGQFQMWTTPWVMQYERVNFLSVTFARYGGQQTVHLTPVASGTTSARQINDQVGGWFQAVQGAVTACRGAVPQVTEPRAVSISAEPAWNKKGIPLFLTFLAALGLVWRFGIPFGSSPQPLALVVFSSLWIVLAALLWFAYGFLHANYAIKRGDLDAVTSNEPPEDWLETASGSNSGRRRLLGSMFFHHSPAVFCVLLLGFYAFFWVHHRGPHFLRQPAVTSAPALESGGTNALEYGSVKEMLVSGQGDHDKRFVDLDTGRRFAAADYFGPNSEPDAEATRQWWHRTGIDVAGDTSPAVQGLVGFEMAAVPVPNEEWQRLPASELNHYLAITQPGTPALMSAKGELPATFAVRTREGGIGLLQIVAFSSHPAGIRIRYKLAHSAGDLKTKTAAASNAAILPPPVVIRTVPVSGADDVDPGLAEIRATFSQPMLNYCWSWTTWGKENYPEMTGNPRYLADERTCVLPVRLKPDKVYAIWLNSWKYHDFRNREGKSAMPYLLIFKTAK